MSAESISGVTSLTMSMLSKKYGNANADELKRVGNKMRRRVQYKPFPHITSEEVFHNVEDHLDELSYFFGEKAMALLIRGDYNQQNIGVIQPSLHARKSRNLDDPMNNQLFMRCVDLVCKEFSKGIHLAMKSSKSDLRNFSTYVTMRKGAGRGFGLDSKRGEEGDRVMTQEVFPVMKRSEKGAFEFANSNDAQTQNVRRAPPGLAKHADGSYSAKHRPSYIHLDKKVHSVSLSTSIDAPEDDISGLRVRHVNAISSRMNVPLMIVNSYYMDNLTPNMFMMLHHTYESINAWGLDGYVSCTDFAQFESTYTKDLRHYIAEKLYSADSLEVVKNIDKSPIVGVYPTFLNGKEDTIYWEIDRSNNELADVFSPLLSGTGDTALLGKAGGLSNQLFNMSLATGIEPEKLMDDKGTYQVSMAAACLRNLGDDAATNWRKLEDFGFTEKQTKHFASDVFEKVKEPGNLIFDITSEHNPYGLFIGYLFKTEEESNPSSKVVSISNDPFSYFIKDIAPEQSADSPIRGNIDIGFIERHMVMKSTIANNYMSTEDFEELWNLKKTILRIEDSDEELLAKAENAKAEILAQEDMSSIARLEAIKILGLTDAKQLDYMVSKGDLMDLPQWIQDELHIPIPASLTNNAALYLNEQNIININ